MKKIFLPYKLAVIAKEKGFNETCIGFYTNQRKLHIYDFESHPDEFIRRTEATLKAPLYQQIIDWLRKEPRFIQIMEQPETFSNDKPMYCVKERGSIISEPYTLKEAIEEVFKLV